LLYEVEEASNWAERVEHYYYFYHWVKIPGVKNIDKKKRYSGIGQRSGSSYRANVSEKSAELNL